MQVVKTKGQVGSDGRLRLDMPVKLPAGTVELTTEGTEDGEADW